MHLKNIVSSGFFKNIYFSGRVLKILGPSESELKKQVFKGLQQREVVVTFFFQGELFLVLLNCFFFN